MTSGNKLLTKAEAAERLNTKESHIRDLIFRKQLSIVKIGRLVRIAESDLEKYIEESRIEASA